MAYLARKQRRNPDTGRMETYFLLRARGQPAEGLGFIPESQAKDILKVKEAQLVLERRAAAPLTTSVATSRPAQVTLGEWWGGPVQPGERELPASRYLDWLRAREASASTLTIALAARKLIVPLIGAVALGEVGQAEVDVVIAESKRRGLRGQTPKHYVHALVRALEAAADYRVIPGAPRLRLPRVKDRREHTWLRPEQMARLIEVLDRRVQAGEVDAQSAVAIVLTERCLLRPGEALTRRWEHVDWTRNTLHVRSVALPGGSTWRAKADSEGTVAIPSDMARRLREYHLLRGRPAEGWMFPAENSEGPQGSYKKALATTCRAAGVPVLHPHSLRHTGATRLCLTGASVQEVQRAGRWRSPSIPLRIYTHLGVDDTRDAVEASVAAHHGRAPE